MFALASAFAASASAAYCNGSPEPGTRVNTNKIWESDNISRLVKEVHNGKMYMVAPPNGTEFRMLHIWGSPYELGYAQGELLGDVVKTFYEEAWAYLKSGFISSIEDSKPSTPLPLASWVAEMGLERSLDFTYDATVSYSGEYFYDEMRGIADASGTDYDLIRRVHMIGELTKGACSFLGAWSSATKDGKTMQLRALDWDTDGPFRNHPAVTVYHPDNGNAFANIGFTGFVGTLSGMNDQAMGVSEIGVSYPDETFEQGIMTGGGNKPEKIKGTPFIFLLRDLLQFENSAESAVQHTADAERTCNLILGVGDGKVDPAESAPVYGMQYSGYVLNAYSDNDLLPNNATWHPVIEDVVWNAMDWNCPSFNGAMAGQLQQYHGALDPAVMVHHVLPTVQTGNLHVALYGLSDRDVTVSFARPRWQDDKGGPLNAFERAYTRLDTTALFAEERPAL